LLIGRFAEKLTDSAPVSFVSEQRNCRCAACYLAVAEAGTIAENCYLFECRILFVVVSHS
jgi:hypothetical protein